MCYGDVISFQFLLKADVNQMGLVCHLVLKTVKITTYIMLAGAFKLDVLIFDVNSFKHLAFLTGIC